MEKSKIVVSRRWKTNLPIQAFATNDEVGARIALKDFILALASELNALDVDPYELKIALQKASERVLTEMKKTTTQVVA